MASSSLTNGYLAAWGEFKTWSPEALDPDLFLPDPDACEVETTVISVDDHVVEPPHLFDEFLAPGLRERGPKLIETPEGHEVWQFEGEVYILTKEEGGRHTPFFNGYRPQFYFRTTDVTGSVNLDEGVEMVIPGDNTNLEVELLTPIAMERGLRFAIREGGRTVGAGSITEILE